MASDGRTPPDCPPEFYERGEVVLLIDGSPNAIERWVQQVAALAGAHLDWHYVGGVANVLYLDEGDDYAPNRIEAAIDQLEGSLEGTVVNRMRR
jgi:electron transfer flavoprotein alpha/beta subunit